MVRNHTIETWHSVWPIIFLIITSSFLNNLHYWRWLSFMQARAVGQHPTRENPKYMNAVKTDELKPKSCFYGNNKLLIVTLINDLLCVGPCSRLLCWLSLTMTLLEAIRIFPFHRWPLRHRKDGLPKCIQLIGGGAQKGPRWSTLQHLCPVPMPHCLSEDQLSCPETSLLSVVTCPMSICLFYIIHTNNKNFI